VLSETVVRIATQLDMEAACCYFVEEYKTSFCLSEVEIVGSYSFLE
jgi:hypothetical protein